MNDTDKNSPKQRLEILIDHLHRREIDVGIISDPKHVFYFTGFLTFKFRFTSILILDVRSRTPSVFLGRSELARIKRVFNGNFFEFEDYDLEKRMIAYPNFVSDRLQLTLKDILGNRNNLKNRIAVEFWNLPKTHLDAIRAAVRGDVEFENISDYILFLRKNKGSDEIKDHKKSAARLDFAYKIANENAKVGNSESDLYREINYEITKNFGPFEFAEMHNILGDYVSGERSLDMGGPATERKFKSGDTIILDLQASVRGHWCDTARTFVVGRRPTEQQKKVFKSILIAKKKAEEIMRPGIACREIYKIVSKEIKDAGYSEFLPHHAGHGLGLEDQEPPFFLPFSEERLEPGMVCALEPGIYDSTAGGMRIEDNYLITRDGFEKLSKYPIRLP